MSEPLRLTATRVAEFFRYGCERQLRYELVPPAGRGGAVPSPNRDPAKGPLVGPRPGAGLLSAAGRRWEERKIRQLVERRGADRVRVASWTDQGQPRRIPAGEVAALLRDPGDAEFLVQPELRLADPAAFLARFGIDPERVTVPPVAPDLIRIRRGRGGVRLQVAEIKASREAAAPHFAQIAFYTFLLEQICREQGIDAAPDLRWGRVWTRDGRGPRRFSLPAYRHHLERLLREEVPRIAAMEPAACAWHLSSRCAGCPYLEHCRDQADRGDDLARVAGITPAAKGVLAEKRIRTVAELAGSFRRDTYQGCHALEAEPHRLKQRAQALRFGKVFEVDGSSPLMPATEDVRVIVTAEGDPVSATCFALGIRVEGRTGDEESVILSARGSVAAERELFREFLARLEAVVAEVDGANRALAGAGERRGMRSLHLYLWDRGELELLRGLMQRHLADVELQPALGRLLRLIAPGTAVPDPAAVRTSPGTVLADVVATLFALPVPYAYDLAGVSGVLLPAAGGAAHRPRPDYAWPLSSQVAFERIHNVWRGRPHRWAGREETPDEVAGGIRDAIRSKLRAIGSVVRAVRERSARREKLPLRKGPLLLASVEEPLPDPALETLRVLAELESATAAAGTRTLHALPVADRARRFEAVRDLHLVERREDGSLVFEFDPECRDVKFRPGDFNLVLTNDDGKSLLSLAREPWKARRLMVELREFVLAVEPPRIVLAPGSGFRKAEADGEIDLDRVCVLDRALNDFNTPRITATLRALAGGGEELRYLRSLLEGRAPEGWTAPFAGAEEALSAVLRRAAAAYGRPALNPDQERAWWGALERCASVVWGPPGTGKTYLLAWMLVGFAAAARAGGRPCRILVTAATHRAIVNVLSRLDAELRTTGLGDVLGAVKLRGSGNPADAELDATAVEVVPDSALAGLVETTEEPVVVGGTVWSLWKQMRRADKDHGGPGHPVRPWFDLVVVDEASQMKVSEALIALSALRPGGQVILCGDDRQLAPITHGRYDEELGTLFGSAFSHFAHRFGRYTLRESRRMNEALVAYPRDLFYPGLVSRVADRRIALLEAPSGAAADPLDGLLAELFLAPVDAVALCTYDGIRAGARNPFEARLAARLARLARERLLDPETGEPYTAARFVSEGLAILSPHRAQNSAIQAELLGAAGFAPGELPVVDTVERMQGNEREVIVVSYGVADREYAEAEAEFLLDPNRFNVSITRPRSKLIVLMSEEILRALPQDEAVLTASMALQGYVGHCSDGLREVELAGPAGEAVRARVRYRRV